MSIQKTAKLVIKASENDPYYGKLNQRQNVEAAIEVGKLCLDFAERGMTDEAMNLGVEHWEGVVSYLEKKLQSIEKRNNKIRERAKIQGRTMKRK